MKLASKQQKNDPGSKQWRFIPQTPFVTPSGIVKIKKNTDGKFKVPHGYIVHMNYCTATKTSNTPIPTKPTVLLSTQQIIPTTAQEIEAMWINLIEKLGKLTTPDSM